MVTTHVMLGHGRLKRYFVRITQYWDFRIMSVCFWSVRWCFIELGLVWFEWRSMPCLSEDYRVKHLYHFGREIRISPPAFRSETLHQFTSAFV